jgi:hypothetical protein
MKIWQGREMPSLVKAFSKALRGAQSYVSLASKLGVAESNAVPPYKLPATGDACERSTRFCRSRTLLLPMVSARKRLEKEESPAQKRMLPLS